MLENFYQRKTVNNPRILGFKILTRHIFCIVVYNLSRCQVTIHIHIFFVINNIMYVLIDIIKYFFAKQILRMFLKK